jgi:hypothetical protein
MQRCVTTQRKKKRCDANATSPKTKNRQHLLARAKPSPTPVAVTPKKKAKGKANKKAANKPKKAEEQTAEESLEAQTQRPQSCNETQGVDDAAFLEDAIKLAAAEKQQLDAAAAAAAAADRERCDHGCEATLPVKELNYCLEYMKTFFSEYIIGLEDRRDNPVQATATACKAAHNKYLKVWDDPDKVRWVVSNFLAKGTRHIVDGDDNNCARHCAAISNFFEQALAKQLLQTSAVNCAKLVETFRCDEHTLVSFFRKRIPCKCLDKKYKELNPSPRWESVAIQNALSPVGKWNARACCNASDVVRHITVPENVKRLVGPRHTSNVVIYVSICKPNSKPRRKLLWKYVTS